MDFRLTHLSDSLVARFGSDLIATLATPCRPKILIVTDGFLGFNPGIGFGLTRFLEGITTHSGVTTKPILTLAFRGGTHMPGSVTIGPDVYQIISNYNFANATSGVTIARYDQVWMFGFNGGAFTMNNNELAALTLFMNQGGGVFATGDHAAVGRQMCGGLPRVRHMREWASIPMGGEAPSTAVNRIDTVVDPGSNNLYEFDDQGDDVPQRIYPNYKVTGATNTTWNATVHPLMMLPGAPINRTNNSGFTKDLDVLPDHPHESVCYATPTGVLNGAYSVQGQNFAEYQPSVADGSVRVGAEIVAYAVSGGRSVIPPGGTAWKPPVRPQMFGVISAYDGRLAQPYGGQTQRPGRIVCDSTWHHYVNVNLDGTSTGRTGLFQLQNGVLVPGPQLLKIYAYYRNIVRWLQPANRVTCQFLWDITALRFDEHLAEEIEGFEGLDTWEGMVAIGRTAEQILESKRGSAALAETLAALLASTGQTAIAETFVTAEATLVRTLSHGILGGAIVKAAQMFPIHDAKAAIEALERGVEKNAKELLRETSRVTKLGFEENVKRAERTITALRLPK